MCLEDEWISCYGESWGTDIVPDAYQHPAKYSRALIRRIYQHCRYENWLAPGSRIVDPFGGVALGALDAMLLGCDWTGCELEPKFQKLAEQNIELWNRRYSGLPKWGNAKCLQGDSRNLRALVGGGDLVCSSPPFATAETRDRSPVQSGEVASAMSRAWTQDRQGITPGQLGSMKADDRGFQVALSSPPFGERHAYPDNERNRARVEKLKANGGQIGGTVIHETCGNSPGQLANLPAGDYSLACSSPPWEQSADAQRTCNENGTRARQATSNRGTYERKYGEEANNIGNSTGESFWSASRLILEALYDVLCPGAHAVFVTKRFVRNKAIVDFPGQWAALCEAVGFQHLHTHHALLTEDRGRQVNTDGNVEHRQVKRSSFFRRLHESKYPHLAIDSEDVQCFLRV